MVLPLLTLVLERDVVPVVLAVFDLACVPVGVELSDVLAEMLGVEERTADAVDVSDAAGVPVTLALPLPDAEGDTDTLEEEDGVEDEVDVLVTAAVREDVGAGLVVRADEPVGEGTGVSVALREAVVDGDTVLLEDNDDADDGEGVVAAVPDALPVPLAVMEGVDDRDAHSAPVPKSTPHISGSCSVRRYVQSYWLPPLDPVAVVSSEMAVMRTTPSSEQANVMCACRCTLFRQLVRSPW